MRDEAPELSSEVRQWATIRRCRRLEDRTDEDTMRSACMRLQDTAGKVCNGLGELRPVRSSRPRGVAEFVGVRCGECASEFALLLAEDIDREPPALLNGGVCSEVLIQTHQHHRWFGGQRGDSADGCAERLSVAFAGDHRNSGSEMTKGPAELAWVERTDDC